MGRCLMLDVAETIYSYPRREGPDAAIDVLAFVLSRPEVILPGVSAEELEAASELLDEVKSIAIARWLEHGAVNRLN